ncbi:MAG: hypothetical protein ABJB10_09745 [Mesorhizobium sp.]
MLLGDVDLEGAALAFNCEMPMWHELHRHIALAANPRARQVPLKQAKQAFDCFDQRHDGSSGAIVQQREERVMRLRAVCLGAIALGLLAGNASADPLSDLAAFPTFYSDAGMTKMKPMAGFKKAWKATRKSDRAAMEKACNDPAMRKAHAPFCANVLALGGAN